MSAWGVGIFENDSALDFLDDFEEIKNLKAYFSESLNQAIETDYLDADYGCEVLVIAALIDVSINDTEYEELTEEYPLILERLKLINISSFKSLALLAVQKVISEHSELNELWHESEDYENFKTEVQNLIERII